MSPRPRETERKPRCAPARRPGLSPLPDATVHPLRWTCVSAPLTPMGAGALTSGGDHMGVLSRTSSSEVRSCDRLADGDDARVVVGVRRARDQHDLLVVAR